MNIQEQIVTGILGVISGGAIAVLLQQLFFKRRAKNAEEDLQRRIAHAKREAENIVKSAQVEVSAELVRKKEDFASEVNQTRSQLRSQEKRLSKREDTLDRQAEQLVQREKQLRESGRELDRKKQSCEAKSKQLSNLVAQQKNQLLKITSMDIEEAKKLLLTRLEPN